MSEQEAGNEEAIEAAEARLIGENPPGTKAWHDQTRVEIRSTIEAAAPLIEAKLKAEYRDGLEERMPDWLLEDIRAAAEEKAKREEWGLRKEVERRAAYLLETLIGIERSGEAGPMEDYETATHELDEILSRPTFLLSDSTTTQEADHA